MASGSLLGLLLLIWSLTNGVVSQKTLQVSPGQNVTLPCTTTEKILDIRKTIVEWKRDGSYVVVFRSGKYVTNQDDHFKNRAELADPELKNENLSLILRKTQLNDRGVYECRFVGAKSRRKTETSVPKLMTSVTLEVKAEETSSGHEAGEDEINAGVGRGHLAVISALVAAVVVVASAAGAFLYKKRKQEPEVDQNVDPEQAAPLSVNTEE